MCVGWIWAVEVCWIWAVEVCWIWAVEVCWVVYSGARDDRAAEEGDGDEAAEVPVEEVRHAATGGARELRRRELLELRSPKQGRWFGERGEKGGRSVLEHGAATHVADIGGNRLGRPHRPMQRAGYVRGE